MFNFSLRTQNKTSSSVLIQKSSAVIPLPTTMADELSQTLGGKDGVESALDAVTTASKKLFANKEGSREQLVRAARELVHAAEHPVEQAYWAFWAEVS